VSAVITGVAAIDVSRLGSTSKRLYCEPCDTVWVDCPVCWSCFEKGVPYVRQEAQ
jgi:hypothetical protein